MHRLEFEISKSHRHGSAVGWRARTEAVLQEVGHRDLIIAIYKCHMNFYRLHTTSAAGVRQRIMGALHVASRLYGVR